MATGSDWNCTCSGGSVGWGRRAVGEGGAWARFAQTAPPQAFQTGGQLSVPVLKEIAATLHQIDSRLARLEAVAQKLQTAKPVDITGEN